MINNQEPPGCQPTTHWEERVLAMEYALQELVVLIGHHVPESRSEILKLCEDWTKSRDVLRAAFRTDNESGVN